MRLCDLKCGVGTHTLMSEFMSHSWICCSVFSWFPDATTMTTTVRMNVMMLENAARGFLEKIPHTHQTKRSRRVPCS